MTLLPLTFVASGATACGGADTYQRALSGSARVVLAADETIAPFYTAVHIEALESAEDREEYDEIMAPWNAAERSIAVCRQVLFSAQASLDSYDGWSEGLVGPACIIDALSHLALALEAIGLEIPSQLTEVLAILGPLSDGMCN